MLNRFKVNSRSTVAQRRVKLSQTSSVAFVFSSAVVDNRQNCSRLVSALTRSVLTKAEQKQPRHPTSPWLPANTTWRHVSLHSVKWLRGSASVLPTLHSRSSLPHKWMQLYKINGWCVPGLLPGTHPHTREAHVRSPHKCPRCAVFTGQRGQGRQQMSADWFLSACSSPRFLSPESSRTKKRPEKRALLIVAGVGSQLGTESHCSFRLLWCMWEEPQEMEKIVRALPIFGQCLRLNLCPWSDARLTEDVGRLDQSMKI